MSRTSASFLITKSSFDMLILPMSACLHHISQMVLSAVVMRPPWRHQDNYQSISVYSTEATREQDIELASSIELAMPYEVPAATSFRKDFPTSRAVCPSH